MAQNRGLPVGGGIKNPLFSNVSQSAFLEEFAASNRLIVGVAPPPQPSISQQAAGSLGLTTTSGPNQHEALNSVPLYSEPTCASSQTVPPSLTPPSSSTGVQQLQQQPPPPLAQQQSTTFTDVPLTADAQPPPAAPIFLPNAGPPPLTGYSRVSPLSRYPRSYIQTTQASQNSGVNLFSPTLPAAQPKLFTPEGQLDNRQPASTPPTSTNLSQLTENPQSAPVGFPSFFTPNPPSATGPPIPDSQTQTPPPSAPIGFPSFFTPNPPPATGPSVPDSQTQTPPPPQPSLQRALAAAVSKVFTGGSSQPHTPVQSIPDAQSPPDPVPLTAEYPYIESKSLPNSSYTIFAPNNSQDFASNPSGPSDQPQPAPLTQSSSSLSSFFSSSPAQNPQQDPPFSYSRFVAPTSTPVAPFQPLPTPPPVSHAPSSTLSYFEPAQTPVISQGAPPPPLATQPTPPPPSAILFAPPPPVSQAPIFTPSHPPPSAIQFAPPPPAVQASIFTPSHQANDNLTQENNTTSPSVQDQNPPPKLFSPVSPATQLNSNSSAFASIPPPASSESHPPSLPSAASFFAPPPTNRESPFRPIKPTTTPPASSLDSSPSSSIASQNLTREPSASSFFNNIGQQNQLFTHSIPPPNSHPTSESPPAAILPVSTECLVEPSPAVEIIPSVVDGSTPSAPPPLTPYQPPPVTSRPPPSAPSITPSIPNAPVSHTPPPTYASLGFKKPELDGQELQQIPLENTVPLYNPKTVGLTHSQQTKDEVQNSYRVSTGLKRPSYAPPPQLPVVPTVQDHQPLTNMSANQYQPHQQRPSLGSQSAQTPPRQDSTAFSAEAGTNVGHYRPAYHHWFFKRGDGKSQWQPFSVADSIKLEHAFSSSDINENTKVATDGCRYDVEVVKRKKHSVFWEEAPGEVRRCSWFVKSQVDSQYVPYDENIAELLEDEYRAGCLRDEWNRRVELADGEVIIFHSAHAMAHYQRPTTPDVRTNPPQMQLNPRIVKRGMEDFEISEGESSQVDHLVLVVHGIGKVCDLRFRSLPHVVDDFRTMSLQLTQAHFSLACERGQVGRVEILPVEWHQALHTETIDKRLADITLPSIPKAREFTNDTILDVLFYSSPVFCEKIVQAVGDELNRVFSLYMERNPSFRGGVSLGGHSLGSLILFDMLTHQKPVATPLATPQTEHHDSEEDEFSEMGFAKTKARVSRRMSYLKIGTLGAGQPFITYPQLNFHPRAFFAFGSPIGMFLTVRGMESLGDDFKFPTCPKFFNIFHPNDPVAYRVEALICNEMANVPPVLIPHHKGRKRMHLELKETMAHVTAALKVKLVDSIRSTWNSVYQLAMFQRPNPTLKNEVDQVLNEEMMRDHGDTLPSPQLSSNQSVTEDVDLDLQVGSLNGGNRIDYVLQEAPLETFNQYISAIRSHLVYWESEDTALLVLKEIYKTLNISADSQVAHQMVPFDISRASEDQYSEYTDSIGAPPTQFVRK